MKLLATIAAWAWTWIALFWAGVVDVFRRPPKDDNMGAADRP